MKIIVAALAAALVVSGAAFAEQKSLAEHEAIAATMSYREAVERQNELMEQGARYNVVPYTRRVYDLMTAAAANKPEYAKHHADVTLHFGSVLVNARQLEEANDVLHIALQLFEEQYGEDAKELIDPLMSLGTAQLQYRKGNINNPYFNRALELAREHDGDNSSLVGRLYYQMSQASLVNASGDWRKASRRLRQSHEILTSELGEDHQDVALSAYRIGELAVLRKKYSEAAEYLESAVRVYDAADPNNRLTQRMHELLVKTYGNLGESDAATKHCQIVGKIKEANGDTEEAGEGYMPIYRTQPRYPAVALRKDLQGQVTVELTVSKEGIPSDIRVISNEGHRSFIKASIAAAEQFRYSARHVDGKPVDTKGVRYRFTYNIAY